MVAVVGLSGAIVILANDLDEVSNPTAAKPLASVNQPGSARYDGGPEEGTRGIGSLAAPSAPDEPHRPGLGDRSAGHAGAGERALRSEDPLAMGRVGIGPMTYGL